MSCCPTCVCNADGPLAVAAKRLLAAEYVACLTDGETIDGDPGGTDAKAIASFCDYLPEALVNAGFSITAHLECGRVITTVHRAAAPRIKEPTT